MKALLIDDLRSPREDFDLFDFTIVRTSQEALDLLKTAPAFDAVFFDHDLGYTLEGEEDTTRRVASFLREQMFLGAQVPIQQFYIHTANPIGANWLKSELQGVAIGHYMPTVIPAGECFTQ